jgi:hypothetical protein
VCKKASLFEFVISLQCFKLERNLIGASGYCTKSIAAIIDARFTFFRGSGRRRRKEDASSRSWKNRFLIISVVDTYRSLAASEIIFLVRFRIRTYGQIRAFQGFFHPY